MARTAQPSDMNWNIVFLCWLIAAVSVMGSMFFSEVMDFAPCALCWWQRIFMFPLAIILLVGLFPFDRNVIRYALPIAAGGWLVALFHTLLYSGVIPESLEPCQQGVSCKEVYIEWLGFITIPMLSLMAFSAMIALLVILRRRLSA